MTLICYSLIVGSRTHACILRCGHPIRTAAIASSTAKEPSTSVVITNVPEKVEKIGFFKKLVYRFKGIPLKDESHAPISFMRDIGKQFVPPPLPELPKDFKEYPERDLVNYPYPVQRMYPPKLRLLIVPDKFMSAFHKYTGTSDRLDKYIYERRKQLEKDYLDIVDNNFKEVRYAQKESKAEKEAYLAMKEYYPTIFKETLALQLEATYRKNVERLATEMQHRLDYLQETVSVKRSFAHSYMLKWIIDSVMAEILSDKENIKERYMENCIEQLKLLSPQG